MLTEAAKEQILAEERFRAEVRRNIEQRGISNRSRLWEIANSAFGLWLLSTCVVGGLTFFYTSHKQAREVASHQQDSIDRLEVEIARRMAELEYEIRRIKEYSPGEQRGRLFEAIQTVRSPREPIFKEFRHRSLSSVLFERYHLARKKRDTARWKSLFDSATALENMYQTPSQPADTAAILTQARRVLGDYAPLSSGAVESGTKPLKRDHPSRRESSLAQRKFPGLIAYIDALRGELPLSYKHPWLSVLMALGAFAALVFGIWGCYHLFQRPGGKFQNFFIIFWTLGPPLYFLVSYHVMFRYFVPEAATTHYWNSQKLYTALWAGIAALTLAILSGRVAKVPPEQ